MLTKFNMIDLFHPLPCLEDMTDLLGLGVILKIKNTSLLCHNNVSRHPLLTSGVSTTASPLGPQQNATSYRPL